MQLEAVDPFYERCAGLVATVAVASLAPDTGAKQREQQIINNIPKADRPAIIESALKESYIWDEVKDELQKPATHGGILMDEPCSALDPLSTLKIEELIVTLKKDYTIVIVTHNMQQAQRVADKTIFIYLGEVIEEGSTADVFDNPKKGTYR